MSSPPVIDRGLMGGNLRHVLKLFTITFYPKDVSTLDKPTMPRELPIPPDALTHRSVEMIRVWLANQQQHIVLNIGFWEERGLDELSAWGLVIADMIHHIANAHESEYRRPRHETIARIRQAFETEMCHETSERLGDFVIEKQNESDPNSTA